MSNTSPGTSLSSTQTFHKASIVSEHIGGLPPHPIFPFEIWDMILRLTWNNFRNFKSQDDLTHLWTCVRPVCQQLKAEVEDIFKTQHLPRTVLHFITDTYYADYDTFSRSRADVWATWQRAPLDHVEQYVFNIQLRFAGLVEKESRRAVFKMQHEPHDPNQPESVYNGIIFRHMREKGGLGPMGEADKYRPSEKRRLFGESEGWGPPSHPVSTFEPQTTEGIYVVQVRAGLNDCPVPGLRIDQMKREITLDWIGLFSRFYGERRASDVLEETDGGLQYPWPPAKHCPLYDGDSLLRDEPLLGHLDYTLVDLATRDYRQLCELSRECQKSLQVVDRLRDPVRTWRNDMGRFVGSERISIGSLLLKRICDCEVNLDDEGEVDNTRADEETLRMTRKVEVWIGAKSICDTCRLEENRCEKRWSFDISGGFSGCKTCFRNNRQCSYHLADLNRYWHSLPLASVLPAGQALRSYAARSSNFRTLQPALEQITTTNRQQTLQQKQDPDHSPRPPQPRFDITSWVVFDLEARASNRKRKNLESSMTGESLYRPGNIQYMQPTLSQHFSYGKILLNVALNSSAEAKVSEKAGGVLSAYAAKGNLFMPIDGLLNQFVQLYPLQYLTLLLFLEPFSGSYVLILVTEKSGGAKKNLTIEYLIRQVMKTRMMEQSIRSSDHYHKCRRSTNRRQGDRALRTGVSDWEINTEQAEVDPGMEDVAHDRNLFSTPHQSFEEQQHQHQHPLQIIYGNKGGVNSFCSPRPRCATQERPRLGSAHNHLERRNVNQPIRKTWSPQLRKQYSDTTHPESLRMSWDHELVTRASPQILNQDRPPSLNLDSQRGSHRDLTVKDLQDHECQETHKVISSSFRHGICIIGRSQHRRYKTNADCLWGSWIEACINNPDQREQQGRNPDHSSSLRPENSIDNKCQHRQQAPLLDHPPSSQIDTPLHLPAQSKQQRTGSIRSFSSKDSGCFKRVVRPVQQGTSYSELGAQISTTTGQHLLQETNLKRLPAFRSMDCISEATRIWSGCSMTIRDPPTIHIFPQLTTHVGSNRQNTFYSTLPNQTDTHPTHSSIKAIDPTNPQPQHINDRHGSSNAFMRNTDPRLPIPFLLINAQTFKELDKLFVEFYVTMELYFTISSRTKKLYSITNGKNHCDPTGYRRTHQHVDQQQETYEKDNEFLAQQLQTLLPTYHDLMHKILPRMRVIRDNIADPEFVALGTTVTDLVERLPRDIQIKWHEDGNAPWLPGHSKARAKPDFVLRSLSSTELRCPSSGLDSKKIGKHLYWEQDEDEEAVTDSACDYHLDTAEVILPTFRETGHRGCMRTAADATATLDSVGHYVVKWWNRPTLRNHTVCTLRRRVRCADNPPSDPPSDELSRSQKDQASPSGDPVVSAELNDDQTINNEPHRMTSRWDSYTVRSHYDPDPTPHSSSRAPLVHNGEGSHPYLIHDHDIHMRNIIETKATSRMTTQLNNTKQMDPRKNSVPSAKEHPKKKLQSQDKHPDSTSTPKALEDNALQPSIPIPDLNMQQQISAQEPIHQPQHSTDSFFKEVKQADP